MTMLDHIAAETVHARHGAERNTFRYGIDYLLLDAEAPLRGPALFGRNRWGLFSLRDRDHGGPPNHGRGAPWAREVLTAHDLPCARLELLAQPRVLGHVFNPVAFWLSHDDTGALRAVIAEVTNTFGDRHSYLCHRDDHWPITAADTLTAAKILHVSPFQPQEGGYRFTFDVTATRIDIRIDYRHGNGALIATLTGDRKPLTNGAILRAMLRRPFGARRVLALIHWQALKLWRKGARYRDRPTPPATEVSRDTFT